MTLSIRDDLGYQVFSVREAPEGWAAAAFPPRSPACAAAETSRSPSPAVVWERISGLPVHESKFTVAVPIHNEAQSLEGFFGSLMYQLLPSQVPAHFVFVVNASTDQSAAMVQATLRRIGNFQWRARSFEADPDAGALIAQARNGNIAFSLVETTKPGKANALNIATELAREAGHRAALCIDADVWVEPNALALVAGEALRTFGHGPFAPTVVSGEPWSTIQPGGDLLIERARRRRGQGPPRPGIWDVTGSLMAWDVEWLSAKGGLPACKLEDYLLGVLSGREGRAIARSSAKVWFYAPNTVREEIRQMRRFVHGSMQILDRFRGDALVEGVIGKGHFPMWPAMDHLANRLRRIAENPLRAPGQLARFVLLEAVKYLGRRDYAQTPDEGTWPALESTKIREPRRAMEITETVAAS